MNFPFDMSLVRQCAPTLAGFKVGSLFCLDMEFRPEIFAALARWNRQLNSKNIFAEIVGERRGRGYIYVFRPNLLQPILSREDVREFLAGFGYADDSPKTVVETLRRRISFRDGFPHEVGIFLGYPLDDVRAFILNGGRNSKLTGEWKTYGNDSESGKIFEACKKCRRTFWKRFSSGTPIERLAVALTPRACVRCSATLPGMSAGASPCP